MDLSAWLRAIHDWWRSLLREQWWQGVAGIAQIVAAILALKTIRQAKKTIEQADEERRLQVNPDWEVLEHQTRPQVGAPLRSSQLMLYNTGFGAARGLEVEFRPHNANPLDKIDVLVSAGMDPLRVLHRTRLVPSGHTVTLEFSWYSHSPIDGLLILSYETRFGEKKETHFHLRLWEDEGREQHCDVEEVPPRR